MGKRMDLTPEEQRACAMLEEQGIGGAEARIAARVILALRPEGWSRLFLSREEVATQVGLTVSGVSWREIHAGSPAGARPVLVKVGASGRREASLWLAPLTLQYYADFPPRDE